MDTLFDSQETQPDPLRSGDLVAYGDTRGVLTVRSETNAVVMANGQARLVPLAELTLIEHRR